MYTDPSGEEFISLGIAILIGAAISAVTYTMTALLADVPFSVGGLLKATFIGAASAAVTFGIGSAANNMFTSWVSSSWQQVARGAFQAIAHGTFQGGMTGISGGKFWSGFAAGALSSIASSAFSFDGNGSAKGLGWASSVRDSGAGMIAFGTVSGGAGAALTGGNFWQGAVTGLVVSGLNHFAHKMQEKATLDGAIRKGGYGKVLDDDPYLNWSNEEIGEFASKVFPDLYKSANCPSFEKQTMIDGNSNIAGQAQALRSGNEGNYTIRSLGKILIRSNVLNSIRQLGSVVGHELNHMTDYVNGTYAGWINKYGRDIGKAYSEVKAYGWEQSMGSKINTQMYNHYLNLTK
jgi:hypothetical protein